MCIIQRVMIIQQTKMELKTLKDLEWKKGQVYSFSERILKQEAIKWIKEFNTDYRIKENMSVCRLPRTVITESFTFNKEGTKLLLPKEAIIKFIKLFFNIEDKDLK